MKHIMKAALLSVAIAISSIPLSSCGASIKTIDPFEKLEVTFSGISGYTGTYETNDPVYDGSQYITYYCPQRDAVLSNGDTITIGYNCADIKAIKKAGYTVETGVTKDFVVEGLPEIPEDLTEAEISQLAEPLSPPEDAPDYQVGDQIESANFTTGFFKEDMSSDYYNKLKAMNYGIWSVEQVTSWKLESNRYEVWKKADIPFSVFGSAYKKEIILKCSGLNSTGQMYADYPDESSDVKLPETGSTVEITLYYCRTYGVSEIYKEKGTLKIPELSGNDYLLTDTIESFDEYMHKEISEKTECIISKEY